MMMTANANPARVTMMMTTVMVTMMTTMATMMAMMVMTTWK
jgi:hypothetical protein